MQISRWLKIGVMVVLLLCGACRWYAADYYYAVDTAVEAMSSVADVVVKQAGNTFVFIPDGAKKGFKVLYRRFSLIVCAARP